MVRMTAVAAFVFLSACSAATPARNEENSPEAVSSTVAAPATLTPSIPKAVVEIHQSEETDRIDYELTVPAEAAALPRLKAKLIREAEEAKAATLREQADYARDFPDAGNKTFGVGHKWRVVGQTDRLLSLVLDVWGYTGGAHGSAGTASLLWDRQEDREVPLAALLTDRLKALTTLRTQYCKRLDIERLEKRGYVLGKESGFADCPPFADLTVAPAGNVGGKFSRILLIADPYVAGPWAEGDYEIELPIPEAMVPFFTPEWKPSFPG